ncbi:MAG: hypothetical protein ACOC6A_02950 [Chloroflexota bacterium]
MSVKRNVPLMVSLLLAALVMASLSAFGNAALFPIVHLSVVLFVLVIVFGLVAMFSNRLRADWMSGVFDAALVYLGLLMIRLAEFESVAKDFGWDTSMIGVGIAIVAFGVGNFQFRRQRESSTPLEPLHEQLTSIAGEIAGLAKRIDELEKGLQRPKRERPR